MTVSEIYDFLKQYIDKKVSEANTELQTLFTNYKTKEIGENINNVNIVGSNIDNINTTALNISNVNTTAGYIDNINTVSGNIDNINTNAININSINTNAGSISNVNTVATYISNVNINAYNIDSINTNTEHIDNIDVVASIKDDILTLNSNYSTYHNDVNLVQAYLNIDLGSATVDQNGHLLVTQIDTSSTPYIDVDGELKIDYT